MTVLFLSPTEQYELSISILFYRLIETLKFGLKSRQDEGWRENRKNYKFMLDEDVDLTLIRLFENFLEDAPQLTLQLYIMSAHGTENDSILSKYINMNITIWQVLLECLCLCNVTLLF